MVNTSQRFNEQPPQILMQDRFASLAKSEVDSSTAMNVDGSSTPVRFFVEAPGLVTGRPIVLTQFGFLLKDSAIEPSKFGGITGGLAEGLLCVYESKAGGSIPFFIEPVKQNWQFALHSPTVGRVTRIQGAADDVLVQGFAFNDGGYCILMLPGDKIVIIVQDDLTDLTAFQMSAHGYFREN